ncbi:hypothetical protein Htur_5242 (plasmid) [Haloterrigena turkmenica DSM 5511]|uniref:Uncharacterized protein n=1 Tax=Haloterrigena turkmenica (strain ATCC 51198 / DSM 5511 / JCM 9101 / NCIMB 13204 / VKM B-1734 / 4k) TaxID=543526 RepID=D2S3C6_HALTV|nr:hypothetical protein [Haloterrigena turkmenica]ADB63873.1 hypothetical protein Htur_5242 [Haloterrigena turkmenica DSM 5511]
MTDEPRVPTDRERLESMLIRQYLERLEALDAETERLLESIAETEPFDEPTRARARRHLREIRAQLHPLTLALRDHPHADDELRDST